MRACEIFDTDPEEFFDAIVEEAALATSMPIVLISLIDEDRQWFKSVRGLDIEETPRDVSFCGHAILGSETMIVPDALKDARFAENSLVIGDPHIRSYAGALLHNAAGVPLGTLCAIDRKPRNLTKVQIQRLEKLARKVSRLIEIRFLNQQAKRQMKELHQTEGQLMNLVSEMFEAA